ncbi:hypothetical protein ACTL6P_20415 [Endozoicomonas acroporae]
MLNKERYELLVDIGADIDRSKYPSSVHPERSRRALRVSGECASNVGII